MITTPGKNFIKVTGIIFIIAGCYSILNAIMVPILKLVLYYLTTNPSYAMQSVLAEHQITQETLSIPSSEIVGLIVLLVVFIIIGIFEIFVGILGVKNCEKPQNSGLLIKAISSYFAVTLILVILSSIFSKFNITFVFYFIIPIFYLLGILKNKKAYQQHLNGENVYF